MSSEKKPSAYELLKSFFDEGSFFETDAYLKGEESAEAVTGYGTVDGVTVVAFAQNVDACGGAMSKTQSMKIRKIYETALKIGAPVVGFFDSVGGRLEQKYELLAAYGEILNSASKLSGVVPQISVITGNCVGASALIARCADFVVMTKSSKLCVSAVGEKASADENLKAGTAQFVCDTDEEAIDTAKKLLSYLPSNNLEPAPAFEAVGAYDQPDKFIKYVADNDSLFCVSCGYGENVCTAFSKIEGSAVALVRTKGGVIDKDGAEKIARHIRFADAFSMPVVTFVDADAFDDLSSACKVVSAYTEATAAKISVIEGKAIGAVYIAFSGVSSSADVVFALDGAIVSPISETAAAYILDSYVAEAPYEAQAEMAKNFALRELTAKKAAEDGYIDDIVDEATARAKIAAALDMLSSKRVSALPKKHSTIL